MAEAPARAALAGNPSDGYGGAVVAVTVPAFRARAWIAGGADLLYSPADGASLVDATVARFQKEYGAGRVGAESVDFETTIPRSVGLGGSSAIVIATLRALCEHHGIDLKPTPMAQLALSIEVDDLEIAAGLQDRLIQCHGGLQFMDFSSSYPDAPRVEALPAANLPPLLIAWRADAAEHSGVVHNDLKSRHEGGDEQVIEAMRQLTEVAKRTREAVRACDLRELRNAVDRTFDLRRVLVKLDPKHVEMIDTAREAGAAANYTGSGGAIVAVCNDLRHRETVAQALRGLGCGTVFFSR